jgi:hypothetical protein
MRFLKRLVCLITPLGLAALAGCASAPLAPTASPQLEQYPFRQATAAVAIGVNPCASKDRVKEVLPAGADYLAGNVLPLQILLRNEGPDDLFVKVTNMRLVASDGGVREALTPAQTYEAIKSEAGGMAYVGLFGVFGVPALMKQRESVMQEVMNVSAKDGVIGPKQMATGVLFYPLQDRDTSLSGTKLTVVVQNPGNLTETTFELPLGGDLPSGRKSTSTDPARVIPPQGR